MANAFVMSRNHLIFGLCLPIAVLLGYLLAEPLDAGGFAVLLLLGGVLTFPLLLKYHYFFLILSWNSCITPFFLPGRPSLWMLMAATSLGLALLGRSVSEKRTFVHAPSITFSLLALLAVVVVTGMTTGGFGSAIFGSSSYGGKGYFFIFAAIMGYFALSSRAIPSQRALFFVAAFFLSGLTAIVSNLTYAAGPKLFFLYELFPAEYASDQAAAEGALDGGGLAASSSLRPKVAPRSR